MSKIKPLDARQIINFIKTSAANYLPPTPLNAKGKNWSDCDVTKLTNAHFAAFGSWVLDELGDKGYKNLMITFAAVLNKYGRKRYGLDIPALSHDWRALIPKKKRTGLTAAEKETATAAAIPALSIKDIKRFAAFDLSKIAPKQQRNAFLLEVYRDFALLMYHTTARPADVLQWDYTHNYNPGTTVRDSVLPLVSIHANFVKNLFYE